MNRRGFLGSILALGVAPAIVKAANLMPVFMRAESGLIVPEAGIVIPTALGGGNTLLTISAITQEALRILEKQLILEWKPQVRAYDVISDFHFSRLERR